MRFFTGTRDNKKGGKASQLFKDRAEAKAKGMPDPSPDEIYKKAIEERMAKMMEQYILSKAKIAKPPGAGEDDSKPREIPKTTQMMLKMMAMKREAKERKMKKRKELQFKREQKQKQWEVEQKRYEEELLKQQKEQELLAEQALRNADPNHSGWW